MNTIHKIPSKPVLKYEHFGAFLYDIAGRYAKRPAVTSYTRRGEERTFTYEEMVHHAMAFGQSLIEAGFGGQHVAIVGENSYEWLIAYLGAIVSGSVAVCIDVEQSDDTIQSMIREADAKLMVVSADFVSICQPLLDEGVDRMVVVDRKGEEGYDAFVALGENAFKEKGGWTRPELSGEQTAVIVYTSGTTSTAKPVMLSHRALMANAAVSIAIVPVDRKSFCSLPFYHTYGLTCAVIGSLIGGYNICIGNLKTILRDIQRFQPRTLVAVPLIVETLHRMIWAGIEKSAKKSTIQRLIRMGRALGRPSMFMPAKLIEGIRSSPIGSLRIIISGGAHLDSTIGEELEAFGILVMQGYGITECSPLVSVNDPFDCDFASVGYVVPGYEIDIRDEEIYVKGVSLMKGYYKRPELTRAALSDGWFGTGDLGYVNKKGQLFITGRKKNLIVMKNGKKISPEEIEGYLSSIPIVQEVVAYGVTQGSSTDDVKLAVMVYPNPREVEGMTSYDILQTLQKEVDRINAKLPSYKQIQMIHIRESEFEKTSSRKIKRQMI